MSGSTPTLVLLFGLLVSGTLATAAATARDDDATSAPATGVSDLPLVEVPAAKNGSDVMAFFASGDGGWARLDREIAGALAADGIPVVGFNALDYYWKPHPPADSAAALERILRHYLKTWNKERFLLIGYSRGANVLPFMASRLPPDLQARTEMIVLIAPSLETTFEFHVTDWMGSQQSDVVPVLPEILKLRGHDILCLFGAEEKDSACPRLPSDIARVEALPGSHHFDGNYRSIAARIIAAAREPA